MGKIDDVFVEEPLEGQLATQLLRQIGVYVGRKKLEGRELSSVMAALGHAVLKMDKYEEKVEKEIIALCERAFDDIHKREKALLSFVQELPDIGDFDLSKFRKVMVLWEKLQNDMNSVWNKEKSKLREEISISQYMQQLLKKDSEIIKTFFEKLKVVKPVLERLNSVAGSYMQRSIRTILNIEQFEEVPLLDANNDNVKKFRQLVIEELERIQRSFTIFSRNFNEKSGEVNSVFQRLKKNKAITEQIILNRLNGCFDINWKRRINAFKEGIQDEILPLFKEEKKLLSKIADAENARLDLIRRIANIMMEIEKQEGKKVDLRNKRIVEFHVPRRKFELKPAFKREIISKHRSLFLGLNNEQVQKKLIILANFIPLLRKQKITPRLVTKIVEKERRIINEKGERALTTLMIRSLAHDHFFKFDNPGIFLQNPSGWSLWDGINYYSILSSEKNEYFFRDFIGQKHTLIIPIDDININYLDIFLYVREKKENEIDKILI